MAWLIFFASVNILLWPSSVNGQADEYFTNSVPMDFYQRVSTKDCPRRFYLDRDINPELIFPIFGGRRANFGEFQHMAAIGWTTNGKTEYLCGGTLISSKFVLTAAHCAQNGNNIAPSVVRLGYTNLEGITDGHQPQQINIRTFRNHPKYRPSRRYYDIALIELESEAEFNDGTCPACLWLEKEVPSEEMDAIGFGATGFGQNLSSDLMKVKLSEINKKDCVERLPVSSRTLPNGFVDEQFCAGSDHMDTCEGDSGGPLQTERIGVDGSVTPLIVGIVSFGTPCTNGSLGAYTRVASYREWIEQEIQQPVDYLSCTQRSNCLSRKQTYSGLKGPFDGHIVRVGLLWNSTDSNRFQCGATLIDYRFALTTAFCAQEKQGRPNYIVVDFTGETIEIDRIVIHPKYKPGIRANDIAVLKLASFLNANRNLRPACLMRGNEESRESSGIWYYSAFRSDQQQLTIAPRITTDWDCTNPVYKRDNMTCRKHSVNLIPTICKIDHGGPVYITEYSDPIPYLHGMVSDLTEGCSGELIAVNVSPHVEWIERVIFDHTEDRLIFQ